MRWSKGSLPGLARLDGPHHDRSAGVRASGHTGAVVAALVLTGAPGSGKTKVLEALTTLLEIEGVEYGAIESEQLSQGSPLLPASQWTPQPEAVLALQRQAARRLFLVTATTETADELRAVIGATRAERTLVVCLRAPPDVVAGRVADREPDRWPGKQPLIAHARTLALAIPLFDGVDLVMDTDARRPEDVAEQIRDAMNAGGLLIPAA
jgi:chloramphenicol 3-O-phosphotransferase